MTEPDPRDIALHRLLRRAYRQPVPTLPPDFDRRVMRALRPPTLHRYGRLLLTAYGLVSALTCAVLQRSQGLSWAYVGVTLLAPLAATSALWWRLQRSR